MEIPFTRSSNDVRGRRRTWNPYQRSAAYVLITEYCAQGKAVWNTPPRR